MSNKMLEIPNVSVSLWVKVRQVLCTSFFVFQWLEVLRLALNKETLYNCITSVLSHTPSKLPCLTRNIFLVIYSILFNSSWKQTLTCCLLLLESVQPVLLYVPA